MEPSADRGYQQRAKFARLLLVGMLAALALTWLWGMFQERTLRQRPENQGLPFGVYWNPKTRQVMLQDFATHFHFCQAVWQRTHPRPYSLEGQEALFRGWTGMLESGMPFAYSPTLVALARPFRGWRVETAFMFFSLLNAGLLAALIHGYVRPRLADGWQCAQVAAAAGSVSLLSAFFIGQSSFVSTGVLGFSWILLERREKTGWWGQAALGAALLVLSAKPSVGLLLGFWLLAFRCWRALALGALACGVACLATAPVLGGWLLWAGDYLHLLGNYHQDGIGAFMSPGLPPRILTNLFGFLVQDGGMADADAAALCRNLWLGGLAALAAGTFAGKIRPCGFLGLSIVWFLIFCPHVSATEDWMLVLAVAARRESQGWRAGLGLFVLILVAVNLRQGLPWESFAPALPAKLILLGWWLLEEAKIGCGGMAKNREKRHPRN